ncbi:DUF2585 family protein [Sphingomonas daechungensis]|uniref:DUF2585 domain-containing protein n=1 Tax=Sphingomonas daechungensis TaxID=1176646 RepID=A0ABX6T264_9SPHN|nr:DUF2585 family protein [Sphingomonas daechungensis]QNP43941.1 DUF2585 domain-containing protein [Sphingomonas daechungensis]
MTRTQRATAAALLIVVAAGALLYMMGRPPICTCGTIDVWISEPNSSRTSQMLSDWYSPSHIVHGFLFYAVLTLLFRKWPVEWRFLAALAIEVSWEIVENTPFIINRYREETAALGYTGDSVLNSISDIAMMTLGFFLARRLPLWASVAIVLVLELIPLIMIRDNLTLNVWMLLAPNDAVKAWQSGG